MVALLCASALGATLQGEGFYSARDQRDIEQLGSHLSSVKRSLQDAPATANGDVVTVHMMCHSHMDVGFQQTAEEYYANRVRAIFEAVITALQGDERLKFSVTEVYYFAQWWRNQTAERRTGVKDLVAKGQLEFLLGAWVANDEACPTFEEVINNVMLGHDFLKNEVGVKAPTIAWLVDSFGHSAATPELLRQMGFSSLFFARISDDQKEQRKKDQELEFLWRPKFETLKANESAPSQGIFTHITHENYAGPCGIDLWVYKEDYGYMDALFKTKAEDLRAKNETLLACLAEYASHYKTKHVLFTMGTDFAYLHANITYGFIDQVAALVQNTSTKYHFVYSTVQQYLDALGAERTRLNFDWPTYEGDFFPLVSEQPGHAWTGYYTTRPNLKKLIREFSGLQQLSTTLYGLLLLESLSERQHPTDPTVQVATFKSQVEALSQMSAKMMHHDTITGTSLQYVIQNETQGLQQAIDENAKIL